VVELIDGAQHTIDISQFTFSVQEIEEAIRCELQIKAA